jgi:hypothetical protein
MPRKDILESRFKESHRKLIIYYWSPNDADGFEKWMQKTRLDMKVMKKIIAQLTIYSTNGLPRQTRKNSGMSRKKSVNSSRPLKSAFSGLMMGRILSLCVWISKKQTSFHLS